MIGKNQEQELVTRKHIIEELRSKGIDTSGFTDAVIADAAAFWKLAQSINTAGIKNGLPVPRDPRKEG